ncbi:class I SAM-dependent methyltransferase [Ornithinibacillus sp. FSL M8-0202]|uniref:class I SAM-dependent methyltransferase n=1 Tax=Ornithinibacillus sp. FSL M8-0202 TaxID=2921616 RepID=UPI0030D52FBD
MQPVNSKTNKEIANEWDDISNIRFEQISNNKDLSFNYILKPCILDLIDSCNIENVLDFGCGTGNLTNYIAECSQKVVGIDLSKNSIKIAKRYFNATENLTFINSSLEEYSNKGNKNNFSLVVANMVLMDVVNLESILKSIKSVLKEDGNFVFTITHPCYWSLYWDYFNKSWFDYKDEIFIEAPFNISLDKNNQKTTHIHRPLEQYINTLCKEGFIIEEMVEPVPDSKMLSLFPTKDNYPRFLGIKSKLF